MVLLLVVYELQELRCHCSAALSPLRDGDHYDALRDCLKALTLNPGHLKAHFRLARCLFELKYVAEALECLNDFKGKFPEQAHSNACDALDKDIKAALFSKSDSGLSAQICAFDFDLSLVIFVTKCTLFKVGMSNRLSWIWTPEWFSKAIWHIRILEKKKIHFAWSRFETVRPAFDSFPVLNRIK